MSLLKRKVQLEDEYSLLSEMEMLHVYGGEGDITITNSGTCSVNLVAGCGVSSGGGSSSGGSSSGGSSSGSSSSNSGSSCGSGCGSSCSCGCNNDNSDNQDSDIVCIGGNAGCF